MTWKQPSIITYKHCTYFLVFFFFSEALKENFLSVADMPTSKMFYIKMHTGCCFFSVFWHLYQHSRWQRQYHCTAHSIKGEKFWSLKTKMPVLWLQQEANKYLLVFLDISDNKLNIFGSWIPKDMAHWALGNILQTLRHPTNQRVNDNKSTNNH